MKRFASKLPILMFAIMLSISLSGGDITVMFMGDSPWILGT